MRPILPLLLLVIPGLAPGVSRAQAVSRTDTPRAGTLRVTVEPVITTWDREYTAGGRHLIGASLPATLFVHSERRVTPLAVEFGLTDRIAVAARLPLVRVMNRARLIRDSAGVALDSVLADTAYAFGPITNTRRGLRYFSGDAELGAKIRFGPSGGPSATAAEIVVRLPTGHQDSPHNLFDLATGDHQTDIEIAVTQELSVAGRLWLNLALRATRQRPGTRERRVAPQTTLLVPRAATTALRWDPGDALALDVAPMLRLGGHLGAGLTAGYFTKRRDHYSFASPADSIALATRLGAPRPAGVLDAGTSERRLRLGAALTYVGPDVEGGVSIEQTVSGAGGGGAAGRIPAATVFRLVLRTSRWPF